MAGASRRSNWTFLLTVIALVAITARGLLPVGYMVSPSAQGRFAAITLCTPQGEITLLRDARTGEIVKPGDNHKQPSSQTSDGHCVFAAMAWIAESPVEPQLAALTPPAPQPQPRLAVRPGLGLAAPPPPATGPPLTA